MNILLVSSEVTPYAQSGGLADVISSLSIELNKTKSVAKVLLPYYKLMKEKHDWHKTDFTLNFNLWGKNHTITLYEYVNNGVTFHAIEHPYFSDREGIYGTTSFEPYSDNFARYYILNYIALKYEEITKFKVDIYHCNDWPTGILPMMIKLSNKESKSIFTIHNLGYQGQFPRFNAEILENFDSTLFENKSYNSPINMLRCALLNSDMITTVSPTYAKEIQSKEFGCNLDNILRKNKNKLIGILNGIDINIWDPKKDPIIPFNYDKSNLKGKSNNKHSLEIEKFGGPSKKPLFGLISRLAEQKGINTLINILPKVLENLDCRVIIVGTGNTDYENRLKALATKYDNLSVNIEFSNDLAHIVESGSDFFLMPSLYEPCGLNQMYSLTYGTLVIASKVGGLADTIEDGKSGFLMDSVTEENIYEAIKKSCELYKDKDTLNKMRKYSMERDFSWKNECSKYIDVYNTVIGGNYDEG